MFSKDLTVADEPPACDMPILPVEKTTTPTPQPSVQCFTSTKVLVFLTATRCSATNRSIKLVRPQRWFRGYGRRVRVRGRKSHPEQIWSAHHQIADVDFSREDFSVGPLRTFSGTPAARRSRRALAGLLYGTINPETASSSSISTPCSPGVTITPDIHPVESSAIRQCDTPCSCSTV
jgi:hypothetical protein